MRHTRRWSIALVATGAVAIVPAQAQAAPTLAGRNVISSSGSKAMVVTLPRDISLSDEAPPNVSFQGGTPWRAVALYGLEAPNGVHPLVALEQFAPPFTPSEFPPRLPAGDYVLVHTGATSAERVTATLHLPGLDGDASFAPFVPFPLHHSERAIRPSASDPATAVVSAMHPARGATFGGMVETRTAHPWVGREQECVYRVNRGDQPSDAEPGCPGGEVGGGGVASDVLLARGVNLVEFTERTYFAWSFSNQRRFGAGWNFRTIAGEHPDVTLESWWIDFADAPPALLESACADGADGVQPVICASFAPFRRARRASDRIHGPFSKHVTERFAVSPRLSRRLATTKLGALFLAPGPESSCAVLVLGKAGSMANCRGNEQLLEGRIVFAFTRRTDRTLIAALLPDGAHGLRLRLKGGAHARVRLQGNAAIAYTSFRRYRGGTLSWVDGAGRRRLTTLPYQRELR